MTALTPGIQRPAGGQIIALTFVLGVAVGLAVTMAPLTWVGAGIVGIIAAVIILVRPELEFYFLFATFQVLLPWSLPKMIIGLVTLSTFIWVLRTRRRLLATQDTLFFLVAAFIGTVWWSAVTADVRVGLLGNILKYTGFLGLYWVIVAMAQDRRVFRNAIWAGLASATVAGLYGLVQVVYPIVWPMSQFRVFEQSAAYEGGTAVTFQGWEGQFRIESFTGTPDVLAYLMIVLLPFAFFWMIRQKRRRRTLFGLSLVLLFSATTALTFSRGAMLSFVVAAIYIAKHFPLRRVVPAFALATLLVVVSGIAYRPLGTRIFSIIHRPKVADVFGMYESSTWRLESYKVGFRMMVDHLALGAGAGQQEHLWETYAPELVPSSVAWIMPLHNTYLLTGVELGALGLLALAALLFFTFKELAGAERVFDESDDLECLHYTWAVKTSLVALLVAAVFSPLLRDFHYFWVLIGLAGALKQISLTQSRRVLP